MFVSLGLVPPGSVLVGVSSSFARSVVVIIDVRIVVLVVEIVVNRYGSQVVIEISKTRITIVQIVSCSTSATIQIVGAKEVTLSE